MDIDKYAIESEEMRILVATAAVKSSATGLIENIHKYRITNQAALIELAKLGAAEDGHILSQRIRKFGIEDQSALFEIAWIALQQTRDALNFMGNFDLELGFRSKLFARYYLIDPAAALVFAQLIFHRPQEAFSAFPILQLLLPGGNINAFAYIFSAWKEKRITLAEGDALVKKCEDLSEETRPQYKAAKMKLAALSCFVAEFSPNSKLLDVIKKLKDEKNPLLLEKKIYEIAVVLMDCQLANTPRETFEALIPTLESILSLQDADLRASLRAHFIKKLHSPQGRAHQSKPMQMTSLLLESFEKYRTDSFTEVSIKQNKNNTVTQTVKVVSFPERVEELLKTDFKDDRRLRDLLKNLLVLIETRDLTEDEKWAVLRNLVFVKIPNLTNREQAKQLLEATQYIVQCIECGKANILKQVTSRQELGAAVKGLFSEAFEITDNDFGTKFSDTIVKWRKSGALLTYANTLKQLPTDEREKALPFIKKFARSVLNGTFAADRYAIDENSSEHWLLLQQNNPQLLEAWKKGAQFPGNVVDTDHPCDLLLAGTEVGSCQGVQNRPHESKCLLAYLWDPKIRIMAVKNPATGEIMARCILRLLWDPEVQQFALFQEITYPKGTHVKALDDACMERAKQLGVSLFRKKKDELEGNITLQSFKGKAPYEYVDALEVESHIVNVSEAGYEISKCFCVYVAPKSI